MKRAAQQWSNASVLRFAGDREPIDAVVQAARELVLAAIDEGWPGPPFDPLKLAEIRGIPASPRADIPDARVLRTSQNRFIIEFNPTRPSGRRRYSIAHEIAHTLFPDCGERVRNRSQSDRLVSDEWQLETLCNIAAAEILMPIGSMAKEETKSLNIDHIAEARRRFDVSTESILIRFSQLSEEPCAVFVASKKDGGSNSDNYSFDYMIPSRNWTYRVARGETVPFGSPILECTAVGFTAKGETMLPGVSEKLRVECIGIPAYPGALFPRVAGFLASRKAADPSPGIEFLRGNILQPRGAGPKLIVHVVSDATPNWGGKGVAIAIKQKWGQAQEDFRRWFGERGKLGAVHYCRVERDLEIATVIAQRGYGPSASPRIRYTALETALRSLVTRAQEHAATVHMPRIGCGQAGGSWAFVEELINSSLVAAKVPVTVYDLPNAGAV